MTDEMILVPRAELLAWAKAWLNDYDPNDGTDCVTPFDTYLLKSPVEAQPAPSPYDRKRIAWELERTAMGDGYYGNALYVAKDFPEATPSERSLLDRWATGKEAGLSDRTDLCAFALQIYAADEESPSAPVGVEGLIERWKRDAARCKADGYTDAAIVKLDCAQQLANLAQQPAAMDEALVEAVRALAKEWRADIEASDMSARADRRNTKPKHFLRDLEKLLKRHGGQRDAQQPAAADGSWAELEIIVKEFFDDPHADAEYVMRKIAALVDRQGGES